MARPVQIVKTNDENNFELCEDNLSEIIGQIPPGMKVGVVSVVGAFRTGKSFLLNFFLRYLRHGNVEDLSEDWMTKDGEFLSEGNMNENNVNVASEDGTTKSTLSFGWRGGEERQTTGIWMWSQPFIRHCPKCREDIAVILVDTQGMFDNETTMTTTAQIFGLSTLIASYQIYNVEKRIQEDNLQHLALFSEYGRMALERPGEDEPEPEPEPEAAPKVGKTPEKAVPAPVDTEGEPLPQPPTPVSPAASLASNISSESLDGKEGEDGFVAVTSTRSTPKASPAPPNPTAPSAAAPLPPVPPAAKALKNSRVARAKSGLTKPFQRLQFLVRDWQNFDVDWDEEVPPDDKETQDSVYATMRQSMDTYLFNVIKDRGMADLQTTREQIVRCFDSVDCFLLPHPGFQVTKKTFNGAINKIEGSFRGLLNRYVRLVFDENIEPKFINNRALTGKELQQFFTTYCRMFQDTDAAGKGSFPKAMTMLEATSEANNRNAQDLALDLYSTRMNNVAGPTCGFIKEHLLMEHHAKIVADAYAQFDDVATMGSESTIAAARAKMVAEIDALKASYCETNALRNPFKDLEIYILPAVFAVLSWLIAQIIDTTCDHFVCEATELAFRRMYGIIFFVIVILAWKHINGALRYLKDVVPLLMKK